MRPIRVFIVRGTWGQTSKEKSEDWCELIAVKAREAIRVYGDRKPVAASVKIIDDVNDGDLRASLYSMMDKVIVFFNSRSNIDTARKFKKNFPRVSVYVMTALIPDDEVTILDKDCLIDSPNLAPFLR